MVGVQNKTVQQSSLKIPHSAEGIGWLAKIVRKRTTLAIVITMALFIVVLVLVVLLTGGRSRGESYKDIPGAAGLNAAIAYDCKKSCEQKFNFNVYILTENGQQVSVVRPDNEGRVRLALPEGNYVMLIARQFDKTFPQEPIALKNGKELEIKLQYKEGGL